jgi:hypothetical protein
MSDHQLATETAVATAAKVAPPASVSIATLMGVQVSELVLWATLIYTCLLIGHKLWQIIKEIQDSK